MIRQFEFLDLPKLPSHLHRLIIENDREVINYKNFKDGVGRKILKDGELIPSTNFPLRKGAEQLVDWVKKNITKNFIHVGSTESDPIKTICGPHLDTSRNYTIIYPIRTGGEKVATVFYRLKSGENPLNHQYYLDYNELEEIDRVVIPVETWCVLNSKCIHAVEGLTSSRLTLQIGLWDYVNLPDL